MTWIKEAAKAGLQGTIKKSQMASEFSFQVVLEAQKHFCPWAFWDTLPFLLWSLLFFFFPKLHWVTIPLLSNKEFLSEVSSNIKCIYSLFLKGKGLLGCYFKNVISLFYCSFHFLLFDQKGENKMCITYLFTFFSFEDNLFKWRDHDIFWYQAWSVWHSTIYMIEPNKNIIMMLHLITKRKNLNWPGT